MATKKKATKAAGPATFYMRVAAKKKLDSLAAAERRGAGQIIEEAVELYIQKIPATTRQIFDIFMKQP